MVNKLDICKFIIFDKEKVGVLGEKIILVRWLSGRKRLLGEQVCRQRHRGFESHPHRSE